MGLVIIFTVVLPTLLVGLFAYCLYLTKGIEREHFFQVFNMEPKALRILIVDDSETTRRVVGTILRSRHWTICGEAENGRSGLEKFQKLKPDVVLLDLSMPDMTGIETAQQMSAADPTVPLILFTILEIEGIGNAAREAGIRAIVPKSEAWNLIPNIERVADEANRHSAAN
jgi:two-component system, chemotaxis family, chemotaxis protein CheY